MPALTAPLQLSANLFVVYSEYPHFDSGNVYLVTGAYPTLIDCGSERAVPQLLRNLALLGLNVRDVHQVIATHGDYDHTQGFHELRKHQPDLPLLINRHDWPTMLEGDPYRNSSYLYQRPFVPFAADQCLPLDEGDVVPAGNTTLTVYHSPGHTEGSVCLLGDVDGRDVLFAGDAIGGSMKSLAGADLQIWANAVVTWTESLQRLATLPFDWVLNGHEPAATLPLERVLVDRLLGSFGKMLNPWFLLGDDDVVTSGVAHTDQNTLQNLPGVPWLPGTSRGESVVGRVPLSGAHLRTADSVRMGSAGSLLLQVDRGPLLPPDASLDGDAGLDPDDLVAGAVGVDEAEVEEGAHVDDVPIGGAFGHHAPA